MGRRPRLLALAVFTAAGFGCTVGGEYVKPVVDTPAQWRVEPLQSAQTADTRWWEQFQDPVLDRLVESVIASNREIVAAVARVDQFSGQLQVARSQLFPQVTYGTDASRGMAAATGTGADRFHTIYQGALGAQWQLDLFGRVRQLSRAAQARVLASEEARRGVVMTATAGVVSAYIALRTLDRQLEIARDSERNYGRTLGIFELRHKGGVVSGVELEQVRSQYLQARAAIPSLERQVAAAEGLITLLAGASPGPVTRGRGIDDLVLPAIPAGLPSSLLERRPDVRQAEQNLRAANASVGAARALHYPQISLTGMLGTASAALSSLLSGPAATASLALGISGPIFSAGAIAGQVASAEAAEREALAGYQQIVLNALRETNDALTGAVKARRQAVDEARRVDSLREYARLSHLRFENGYAGYSDVLYAQNTLFAAELAAAGTLGDQFAQVVGVYKAMGGGWIDLADASAGASASSSGKPPSR